MDLQCESGHTVPTHKPPGAGGGGDGGTDEGKHTIYIP